jgi:hypothetical protein
MHNPFFRIALISLLFFCNNLTAKNTFLIDSVVVSDTLQYKEFVFEFNAKIAVFPSITDKNLLDSIYNSFVLIYKDDNPIYLQAKDFSKQGIIEALKKIENNFFADFTKDENVIEMPDYVSQYYFSIEIMPISHNDNLLRLQCYTEFWFGWFHPLYTEFNKNFDLQTNKPILNTDIFKNVNDTAFEKLLANNYFAQDTNNIYCFLSDDTTTIKMSDNFYFDKDSITFVYNPYEITSWDCGFQYITLSFNKIKKYLKPEFIKKISKDYNFSFLNNKKHILISIC